MDSKKLIFTIDSAYINKYKLDQSFLGKNIVMFSDRLNHIAKHKFDFSSIQDYQNAINNIDDIVKKRILL